MAVRFPARLNRRNALEASDVVVKDFSPEGVKILASQRFSLFDHLSISFAPANNTAAIAMNGHVVWIDKDNFGAWHIGVKFDQIDLMKANRVMEFLE